jgi:RND family efflux transporter MFP subunit
MTDETPTEAKDAARPAAPHAEASGVPALRPQPVAPARARPRRWPWVAALVLALAGAVVLYFQPWSDRAVPVTSETVERGPVTRVLAVNGRIAALHSVDIRALVGGTLGDLPVAEGDTVAEGDVLARIDSAAQQAVVRQAVAGLDAALVAEARARDALDRAVALGANIPRTEREAAERALMTARQDVARATAQVDQAQVQLENHTMRAPMAGTVLSLNVEPGQAIDPATVLMTLADLDRLIVETDVDEAYATQIREGQEALLQLSGEAGTREGRVSFVSQRVDPDTGGLAVELSFDQPLRAPVGLTVTTNIVVERHEDAITAPRAAIEDGAVYVVVDGLALRRPVSVIDWPAERLVVTEGLATGDVLITDAEGLSEGQMVKVAVP